MFFEAKLFNKNKEFITSTDWFQSFEDNRDVRNFTFFGLQPGVYFIQTNPPLIWYGGRNGKSITIRNKNINLNYMSIINRIRRFYFDPIRVY